MRKIIFTFILILVLSPNVFAEIQNVFAEIQIKAGGNFTSMRAGDANTDIPGFYFGLERFFSKRFGMAFKVRKEGGEFSSLGNGYYFSFAGVYKAQPNILKEIHEDIFCKVSAGAEFAFPYVDYNAFKETEWTRRWTYINQRGGLIVPYPFTGITVEVPLKKSFFKMKDFVIEIGTQVNIVSFGIKEAVVDHNTGIFVPTIDEKVLRFVPVFFVGLGFRF